MTEIKQITKIDIGELMLEVAKNAKYITPEMQNLIARFMDVQTKPAIFLKVKKARR